MDGSLLEEKSSFKMLGLTCSSKLDWGSYNISIAKTASKKIRASIRSMKFLSPEVAQYLYKSTIWPFIEYCCHVWAGAPSCYLEFLDKLQKRICKTVGPSLAASLELLAYRCRVSPSGGGGGTGGIPPTTPKMGLSTHCFDPQMPILSFSCSFWPFCRNCPPPHQSTPFGKP